MKTDKPNRPIRVGLISLGCAKNLVDAEIMLGSLMKGGVEITNDALGLKDKSSKMFRVGEKPGKSVGETENSEERPKHSTGTKKSGPKKH